MLAIQIIMPSEGDMIMLHQEGGTLLLQPVFYGGDCAGPHINVVDVNEHTNEITDIVSRSRLRIRPDGKIEVRRGGTAEETKAE